MPTRQSRFLCRQFGNHIQIADTKNGRRSTEKCQWEIFFRHCLLKYTYSSLSLDLSLFLYINRNINIYIYCILRDTCTSLCIFFWSYIPRYDVERLRSGFLEAGLLDHWNRSLKFNRTNLEFSIRKTLLTLLVPSGESCSDGAEIFSVAFFNYLKHTIFYALILFFSPTGKSY
jgi:hypothetical protein